MTYEDVIETLIVLGAPLELRGIKMAYEDVIETLIVMGAPLELIEEVMGELDDYNFKTWDQCYTAAIKLGVGNPKEVADMLRRVI
jgi:hypothetical protein